MKQVLCFGENFPNFSNSCYSLVDFKSLGMLRSVQSRFYNCRFSFIWKKWRRPSSVKLK